MAVDICFDIENDGFLDTTSKVHCICLIVRGPTHKDVAYEFGPDELGLALDYLNTADRLIGHNIQSHDLPVLEKLCGWRPREGVVIRDTLVCARLKHPDIRDKDKADLQMPTVYRGSHSIGAWGYRLGERKIHEDITDWSAWTAAMQERCAQDVKVNLALWDHLDADAYSQDAVALEHAVDLLVRKMERAGVPFDSSSAGALHVELMAEKERLEKELVSQFGSWLAPDGPKDGLRIPKRTSIRDGIQYRDDAPYTKLKLVTFNPQSRQHIERVLRLRGWNPTEFTPSGQAKIDEAVIDALTKRFPEIDGLGRLMLVNKRLSQLVEGDSALLRSTGSDGRIHGVINPMGTQTSRASHSRPNLAQVPSSKSPYGDRFRALFKVYGGWSLVGADQSGLEGRGLAHFLGAFDGGKYADILLKGDPHWASTRALGFVDGDEVRDKHNPYHVVVREGSKTFYYAFLYGAGDTKLGTIIHDICMAAEAAGYPDQMARLFPRGGGKRVLARVGGEARERFEAGIAGLDRLVAKAQGHVCKYGWVPGLDGRRIPARSEHSALNYLIQSAGAIVCKRWIVEAYAELARRGYRHGWDGDYVFCLWVHDEAQVACRKGLEDEVGTILTETAKAAGRYYDLRIPLDSEYSAGQSWADTH